MSRMFSLLVVVLSIAAGLARAGEDPNAPWVERVRQICSGTPRPRRVMLVFPLTRPDSEGGESGWGRGLVALHSMWLSSFGRERLLDTWDFDLERIYADLQLWGPGRTVTPDKIEAACAVFETDNYTTGTLSVDDESFSAEIIIRGQNGEVEKSYSGPRSDVTELPNHIAMDLLDYMEFEVPENDRGVIAKRVLGPVDLYDQAADRFCAEYYFSQDYVPWWYWLLQRYQSTWTEYMYRRTCGNRSASWALDSWGRIPTQGPALPLDYIKVRFAFTDADRAGDYASAGRMLAEVLGRDPYNPSLLRNVAQALAELGEDEAVQEVMDRFVALYGDGVLAGVNRGEFLVDYAWVARGSGWASTVTEEGWDLFHERLARAKTVLEAVKAHEPLCWMADVELITVGMASHEGLGYAMSHLEDAVTICPTAPEGYRKMMNFLQPKWGGSMYQVLSLGRHCAGTELYQSAVPTILIDAHIILGRAQPGADEDSSVFWDYIYSPDVWKEIEPVLIRIVEANPHAYFYVTMLLAGARRHDDRALAGRMVQTFRADSNRFVFQAPNAHVLHKEEYESIYRWASEGWPPLHTAAVDRDLQKLKDLIGEGADVNQTAEGGWTALHLAVHSYDREIVRVLAEAGADVDAVNGQGMAALHMAARGGLVSVVEALLEAGADLELRNRKGFTPLHLAAEAGAENTALTLLSRAADVNSRADDGSTPLHQAAGQWDIEVLEVLLKHGADVNACSQTGRTPLTWAATGGRTAVMEKLIEAGADVNDQDDTGQRALHLAARYNHSEAIELLLEHGAEIDAPDEGGNTPLHTAARYDTMKATRALLEGGADLNRENNGGKTPLNLAESRDNSEVAALLREHGAK